jgi:NTP pyrophosphatase (non-canonical NTP hydrolase)
VHTEAYESRAEAARREKFLKTGVGRKHLQVLINKIIAEVAELADALDSKSSRA